MSAKEWSTRKASAISSLPLVGTTFFDERYGLTIKIVKIEAITSKADGGCRCLSEHGQMANHSASAETEQ